MSGGQFTPRETSASGTPVSSGFRPVPMRLLLPNIVTLLALCLGLTAIRFAWKERWNGR